MKNNDLVSVVIPIFNVEKYLEKCEFVSKSNIQKS